jgi:hypothetical protein
MMLLLTATTVMLRDTGQGITSQMFAVTLIAAQATV